MFLNLKFSLEHKSIFFWEWKINFLRILLLSWQYSTNFNINVVVSKFKPTAVNFKKFSVFISYNQT